MNADQHPHPSHQPPPEATVEPREGPDPSASMAPEAIQAADVDRNPQTGDALDLDRPARGVDWVRASDLVSRGSGYLSRRGIDLQADLFGRARSGIATGARHVAAGVKRLSPLSAFGREEPALEARGLGRE
ncbi:hypothetical protein ACT3TZ_10925 [Brachybacterium sp. AOP25-B2-12]|uniref:hypothetical protein n=1 Tax=Brachybacterium sp. AOP25-B2-12 TaxID=3457710 RepID=UPI004034DC79